MTVSSPVPGPVPTTLLFVPGDRPERFDKAVASGADLVVLDLEDAVAPTGKDAAREHVRRWLRELGPAAAAVRVNPAGVPGHDEDLAALAGAVDLVLVPKAEDPAGLDRVAGRLGGGVRLLALVETATGVLAAPAIARARSVQRLVLGTYDLAAQLGVSPDDRLAMASARQALVLASAAAGLAPPVDGVTGAVGDEAALRDDLDHAVRLGLGGKLCVHPRQVPVAAAAFRPSADEVAWAERVVAAAGSPGAAGSAGSPAAAGSSGVVVLDGVMVDKPVVDRARRVLARRDDARGQPR